MISPLTGNRTSLTRHKVSKSIIRTKIKIQLSLREATHQWDKRLIWEPLQTDGKRERKVNLMRGEEGDHTRDIRDFRRRNHRHLITPQTRESCPC